MSTHYSFVLELTPVPRTPAVLSVLTVLREKYLGRLQAWPGDGNSVRTAAGPIVLGEDVSVEIDVAEDPADTARVFVTVELEDRAYAIAYDLLRSRTKRKGKRGLIGLCVAVAAAAGAQGFRLGFQAQPRSPLTTAALVQALISVDANPGTFSGLQAGCPEWNLVKDYYPGWQRVGDYQVLSLI